MYLRKCLVLVYGAMTIPFTSISADNVNVALHKPVIAVSYTHLTLPTKA